MKPKEVTASTPVRQAISPPTEPRPEKCFHIIESAGTRARYGLSLRLAVRLICLAHSLPRPFRRGDS